MTETPAPQKQLYFSSKFLSLPANGHSFEIPNFRHRAAVFPHKVPVFCFQMVIVFRVFLDFGLEKAPILFHAVLNFRLQFSGKTSLISASKQSYSSVRYLCFVSDKPYSNP